MKTIKK